ncbi:MEDS domain-containing protein [Streptomyces chattanoogensis]|uniref:MEDS domain-containing protein n=1 Tax=Streptomyces chattanoogensis TaxID=66876 RepID=UPI0006B4BA2F|nr:MEDS domain-containing protein [Streptomyces chattanoogensis]
MPARDTTSGRFLPVRRLRPGDHACVGYGDDEVRRDAVTAFVRPGPARGERVMLLPCPAVPEEDVPARIDFPGPGTAPACERGQLVLSGLRAVLRPDAELSAARQPGRPRTETGRATAGGMRVCGPSSAGAGRPRSARTSPW